MEDNYGLIFIPNQPIIFNHNSDPCRGILDGGYCQPFATDTEIEIQMIRTPCGDNLACENTDPSYGANIMVDSDFSQPDLSAWTVEGAAWTLNAGKAQKTGIGGSSIYQLLAGAIGVFRIRVTVSGATTGTGGLRAGTTFIMDCSTDGTYEAIYMNTVDPFGIGFYGSNLFDGSIDDFTVEPVTYCMVGIGWIYNPSTDFYVHLPGNTLPLLADTTYIVPNKWYQIQIEIEDRNVGEVRVVAGSNGSNWISENGYHTVTVFSGITADIGIEPDTTFDGAARIVSVYELSEPTQIEMMTLDSPPDSVANLLPYYSLDGDRVNIKFSFDQLVADDAFAVVPDLPFCFQIAVDSICSPIGGNLVFNGTFSSGSADWTPPSSPGNLQVVYASNQLEFNFTPYEGTDYVTNGDFASGDFTGWTASGGLSVVGNAVHHASGTTDTLTQSITIPAMPPPPGSVLQFFVGVSVSGRTQGSIQVSLSDVNSVILTANDDMVVRLIPTVGGTVNLTITFSSDFDGVVDDIFMFETTGVWSANVVARNTVNPLIVQGNYELSFEIISSTDARIKAGVYIEGQTQPTQFFSVPGVHTVQVTNYIPGNQRVIVQGRFVEDNYNMIGSIVVDNIIARPEQSTTQPKLSNCVSILPDEDLECYKELVAYSHCTNHGFDFRNFRLRLLVPFLRWGAIYPQNDNVYLHSSGLNIRTSSQRDKVWSAKVDKVDEVTHDTISVMLLQDEFTVDGDSFFLKSKAYNVQHNKNARHNLSRATFELSKQDSVVFGNICRDCDDLIAPIECRELCAIYSGMLGEEVESVSGYFYDENENLVWFWSGEEFLSSSPCSGYIRRADAAVMLFFNDVTMTWDNFISIDSLIVSGSSGTLTATIPFNCAAQVMVASTQSDEALEPVTAMFTAQQIADGVDFPAPEGNFYAVIRVRCGSCIYHSPFYHYEE